MHGLEGRNTQLIALLGPPGLAPQLMALLSRQGFFCRHALALARERPSGPRPALMPLSAADLGALANGGCPRPPINAAYICIGPVVLTPSCPFGCSGCSALHRCGRYSRMDY